MILFLILFSFIFSLKPIEAKAFSYQFNLSDNVINLDFYRALDLPLPIIKNQPILTTTITPTLTVTPTPAPHKKILTFDYRIKTSKTLPTDLPLFIVVFGQQVVFSVDALMADDAIHHVELDLELFNISFIDQTPIFYQNNYLNDYELNLTNLSFLENFSVTQNENENIAKIENLSAIREVDQSLTIIFSLSNPEKNLDSYSLLCTDENQQLLSSIKLVKKDDFLWPNFSFSNFSTNNKNDLIFHLEEYSCAGLMSVSSVSGDKFDIGSIVEAKDL